MHEQLKASYLHGKFARGREDEDTRDGDAARAEEEPL